mmetsp:Transcript_9035/g.23002  ORF Transcript_9035/g.23002 Transcript_9035/m.23002 type:complete len:81 (-) Transcript_9035:118-360(-)
MTGRRARSSRPQADASSACACPRRCVSEEMRTLLARVLARPELLELPKLAELLTFVLKAHAHLRPGRERKRAKKSSACSA